MENKKLIEIKNKFYELYDNVFNYLELCHSEIDLKSIRESFEHLYIKVMFKDVLRGDDYYPSLDRCLIISEMLLDIDFEISRQVQEIMELFSLLYYGNISTKYFTFLTK